MSKNKFEITELPERSARSRKPDPLIVELVEFLKANPGCWVKWPHRIKLKYAGALATAINHNRPTMPAAMRSGGFRASVRQKQLYVRYVGEDDNG